MATDDVIALAVQSIVDLLRANIPPLAPAGRILTARPDQFDSIQNSSEPAVTVCLYRVSLNEAMRNTTQRLLPNGRLEVPRLPLNLHFLLTPWAAEAEDEFKILGRVIRILHDYGDLRGAHLQGNSWEEDDSIQLSVESAPVDDIVRLWETTHLPYRLSALFVAHVSSLSSGQPGETVNPESPRKPNL